MARSMTEQGRVRYPGRLARDDALARLRRVHGQLGGVIHMMEQDRSTTEVLTLLAAVTHALHRAGFRMVADELERCRAPAKRSGPRCAARLFPG
jgi:DNA-binding FrmR family transcriptional regulator